MVAEKTFEIASEVDGNSDWFGTVEPLWDRTARGQ
jgi:hypothetical protein